MALFVVATPIGNLEDISSRALKTLREVQLVIAEDTRVTKKLLNHFGLGTRLLAFHEYSEPAKLVPILEVLDRGKDAALVTDAGTPAISDPGAYLIELILRERPGTRVIPIPGPSALTAALSVSGLRAAPFTFLGFPPAKKGRRSFFSGLNGLEGALVIYEAPHRIVKTLEELCTALPGERRAYAGRELTKIHETHYRGTLRQVTEAVKADTIKGEYVIIVERELKKSSGSPCSALAATRRRASSPLPLKRGNKL
ncbi:16S rRNA (cytidine(1402)-2'-O)-methyltransferase [Patescibacteria group bacterium]|nr:MAG: 16S rRNA (cytidine(1402)-2'-O)-methyltransferase [Patescibacteria group bacterium]